MKLKEIFSPTTLRDFCIQIAKLHPFTLGWIVAFTIYRLLSIYDVIQGTSVIDFCLAEGFFMSLAVDIWTDYMNKRRLYVILEAITVLLVVTDCIITSYVGGFDSQANFVGHLSLMTGLVVACIFVPFVGSEVNNRTQTYSQIINIFKSIGLALVLSIASSILMLLLTILFHVDNYNFYISVLLIFGVVFPAFLFVGLQRTAEKTIESKPIMFGGAFCKFVLLPISLIYFIVLYVYLFKILFNWELPDGGLTWMVTVQMVIVLLTLYGLRDYALDSDASESNVNINRLAMRWLPLLIFPLLVLMTIGLVYRLNQYGVTASRIYVAAFLIWAYFIDIYLIVKQHKASLNLIAISFAVLFVTVSVIPGCNITTITDNIIRTEIKEAFAGNQMPMTMTQAKNALANMPEEKATNIASKIQYLDSYDDHALVNDIVISDSRIWEYDLLPDRSAVSLVTYSWCNDFEVPAGFTHFEYDEIIDLNNYSIDKQELLTAVQCENYPQVNIWAKDSTSIAVVTSATIYNSTDSTENVIDSISAIVFFNK